MTVVSTSHHYMLVGQGLALQLQPCTSSMLCGPELNTSLSVALLCHEMKQSGVL